MKGYVAHLYDVDRIAIPEDMLTVCVKEDQIEEQLSYLSLRYAEESYTDCVERRDIITCGVDSESYPDGRSILIFTGTSVPGSAQAAKDSIGRKIGETFLTTLCGNPVALTVRKILHRVPVEVNDELIASLGIEGVRTVNAYKDYLREKAIANARMEQTKEINVYLLDQMEALSTYIYDKKEMDRYVEEMMPRYIKEMEEMGIEETPEDLKKIIISQQKQAWIAEAFCKSRNIEIDRAAVEEDMDRMIEMMSLMGEEIPEREEMFEMSLRDAYSMKMFACMEKIVAEKLGGDHGNR